MLPAASSTPVSHSSMSAVKLGAKDLLRPLSQIRLSFKGSEERQIPALPAMVCHPAADQVQGWPQLSLGQLVHQVMEFLAHCAHGRILRAAGISAASRPRQAATAWQLPSGQHRVVLAMTNSVGPILIRPIGFSAPAGVDGAVPG